MPIFAWFIYPLKLDMQKLFSVIILATIFFTACKKEAAPNSSPSQLYQFSFELNGKVHTVDSVTATNKIVTDILVIGGFPVTFRKIEFLRGRYSGQTDSINLINRDFVTLNFNIINYSVSPDSILGEYKYPNAPYQGKQFAANFNIYSNQNPGGARIQYLFTQGLSTVCTIKSIQNKFINGTFSGYACKNAGIGDSVLISNGVFNLPVTE
jgi:hypothetical protein